MYTYTCLVICIYLYVVLVCDTFHLMDISEFCESQCSENLHTCSSQLSSTDTVSNTTPKHHQMAAIAPQYNYCHAANYL